MNHRIQCQVLKVTRNCYKEIRRYQLTRVGPCIAARPVHAGQTILHLEEDKLNSKGKQEDEDDDVVCTHCQPPVTASQKVASEL
jgi:hypothetical protein